MSAETEAVDTAALSVAVTTLLQQQGAIASDVAAMRADVGKALTRLEVIESRRGADEETRHDVESRLRALERWRYALPVGVVLGGASTAITIIENWPRH